MADAHEATEASRVAHALGLEYKIYGTVVAFDSADIRNLADLIDPTCHIVRVDDTYNTPETGRVDEWHYKCSKCGIELDDNDTDAMDSGVKPFDYCPYCGARVTRVVSDDGEGQRLPRHVRRMRAFRP